MKSASRKFLSCMFCGGERPLTAEHIFGRSISGRFKDQRLAMVPKSVASRLNEPSYPEGKSKHYRGAGSTPLSLTSYSMCKSCNHELGKEFTQLTGVLVKLFRGETNKIRQEHCKSAIRYFQRIGILVDLECAEFDPRLMTESEKDIEANRHSHSEVPLDL